MTYAKRMKVLGILILAVAVGCRWSPTGPAASHSAVKPFRSPEPDQSNDAVVNAVDPAYLMNTIATLSASGLAGRKLGDLGGVKAGAWLASRLNEYHLARYPESRRNPLADPPDGRIRIQRFELKNGVQGHNILAYIPPLLHRGVSGQTGDSQTVMAEDSDPSGNTRFVPDGFILVVAHYDGEGRTGTGGYYPAANDNASGTAVALELARVFQQYPPEKTGIVFLFTDGEEAGLIGSTYFVMREQAALSDCRLVINLDMLGRPFMDYPFMPSLFGSLTACVMSESAAPWRETLVRIARRRRMPLLFWSTVGMTAELSGRLVGFMHDGAVFERLGIPMIFFSNGIYTDYSRPTDVIESISPAMLLRRTRLIAAFIHVVTGPRRK